MRFIAFGGLLELCSVYYLRFAKIFCAKTCVYRKNVVHLHRKLKLSTMRKFFCGIVAVLFAATTEITVICIQKDGIHNKCTPPIALRIIIPPLFTTYSYGGG